MVRLTEEETVVPSVFVTVQVIVVSLVERIFPAVVSEITPLLLIFTYDVADDV